jgi:hypothetical protein
MVISPWPVGMGNRGVLNFVRDIASPVPQAVAHAYQRHLTQGHGIADQQDEGKEAAHGKA